MCVCLLAVAVSYFFFYYYFTFGPYVCVCVCVWNLCTVSVHWISFKVIPIILLYCVQFSVFDFYFDVCHSLWLLLTSIRCKVFVLSVWEQAILWFSLIAIIAYLIRFRLFGLLFYTNHMAIPFDQPFHWDSLLKNESIFYGINYSKRANRIFMFSLML